MQPMICRSIICILLRCLGQDIDFEVDSGGLINLEINFDLF